jgi:DNA repair ATPase RecN
MREYSAESLRAVAEGVSRQLNAKAGLDIKEVCNWAAEEIEHLTPKAMEVELLKEKVHRLQVENQILRKGNRKILIGQINNDYNKR